jgi:hypothetical protein
MARLTGARTLIWKDPFALFTLDDLLTLGHERIVVTFRKPAAIASSFERLGWGFDVADLESRLRVAGVPVPHVPDFDTTGSRHVDSALRLYLLGYGYALDVSRRHPGVLLVDNGDLARDADRLVGALRSRLGLPARPPSRTSRSGAVPTPRPGKAYGKRAHAAHRDLTQVNSYYSEILTAEQVSRIEALTDDLHSALSAAAFRP